MDRTVDVQPFTCREPVDRTVDVQPFTCREPVDRTVDMQPFTCREPVDRTIDVQPFICREPVDRIVDVQPFTCREPVDRIVDVTYHCWEGRASFTPVCTVCGRLIISPSCTHIVMASSYEPHATTGLQDTRTSIHTCHRSVYWISTSPNRQKEQSF